MIGQIIGGLIVGILARLLLPGKEAFPDGPQRELWPGISYVRVRLTWARYSDFRPGGAVTELALD